eukprot:11900492-Ditylum_brightwellii.AAC.1
MTWVKVQAGGYKINDGQEKGKGTCYWCGGNHLLVCVCPEVESSGLKQVKMGPKFHAPKDKESHIKLIYGHIMC